MSYIKLNFEYLKQFLNQDVSVLKQKAEESLNNLHQKQGKGNDYMGWVSLPFDYDKNEFEQILKLRNEIQQNADCLVVIGIGGSYLGAKAAIDYLQSKSEQKVEVIFMGNDISSYQLNKKLNYLKNKNFYVNVISKSGTTLEPAVAFRFVKKLTEEKYGKEASQRIISTTDPKDGALRKLSLEQGYRLLTIPKNVGGRYSVLTAVGLLPIAVAGYCIKDMMQGALDAYNDFKDKSLEENVALQHAIYRNLLHTQLGKNVDLFVTNQPELTAYMEWIKQLFGESEGKEQKGLFPASCIFTTDLHSLGQYIQQGSPILFETVLKLEKEHDIVKVFETIDNSDGLNYLTGKELSFINEKALEGTVKAHLEGGVPVLELAIPEISEYSFGYLSYYLMLVCGVSCALLYVNPFDQPGVEFYKKNMFKLLGKK